MGLEFWAIISTVWLALLCFIGTMIPLVAAYFAVRGMHAVLGKSRSAFTAAQSYSGVMRRKADELSEKVAAPVLKAEVKAAESEETIRSLANDIRG